MATERSPGQGRIVWKQWLCRAPWAFGLAGAVAADHRAAHSAGAIGFGWTFGLIVPGNVFQPALPGCFAQVARTLRERAGTSLWFGFALLVCMRVAAPPFFIALVGSAALLAGLGVLSLQARTRAPTAA
jgi:hypothetical protein